MSARIKVLVTSVMVCCMLLLSLVAFTGSAFAATSPPTFHNNPNSVTPNAAGCISWTVTGNNYPAGATVGIFFDVPLINVAHAYANGNFTQAERVCPPFDTPGRHIVQGDVLPFGGGAGDHLTVMT